MHHSYISGLNRHQLFLYTDLILDDKKFDFESKRDLIEYLAMFFDSKAVSQIRRNREGESLHSVSKEDFDQQVKDRSFLSKEVLDIAKSLKNTNLYNNSSNKSKEKAAKRNIDKKTIFKIIED